MSGQTQLRLDHLSLKNFRCFAECDIDLHPELTVLVAENGRGKTAIVDAIKVALSIFVDTLMQAKPLRGFDQKDIRLVPRENAEMEPVLPTEFSAIGYAGDREIKWSRVLKPGKTRFHTTTKQAVELSKAAQVLRDQLADQSLISMADSVVLPLVAYYGTGRLWKEFVPAKRRAIAVPSIDRLDGYTECLSSASAFAGVIGWYERKMEEVRDPRFSGANSANVSLLTAVREATATILEPTGWTDLNWDPIQRTLVVRHPHFGQLPLWAHSDGIRNTIALIVDIARRCASLNPDIGDAVVKNTPGIVIIDEVDLHLHPRWQQQVVGLLRKAFPALQMILSTHSPQVLSTLDKESIRMVSLGNDGQGLISTPPMQTRGVESADVLAEIMKVDSIPQIEEATKLSRYKALIEDGRAETPEALLMRSELIAHFGEHHLVIQDCDRLIRFQTFRLKRSRPEES